MALDGLPRPGAERPRPERLWASDDLRALAGLLARIEPERATEAAVLLTELETAQEELRVADEELRTQRDTLETLLDDRAVSAAQREWLASLLPVPMLVTDATGRITSANAAASSLLNLALPTLIGKPLPALVHTDDRRVVRSALGVAGDSPARVEVRLVPRRQRPLPTLLAVTAARDAPQERIELSWTVIASGADAMVAGRSLDALRLVSAFAEISRVPTTEDDLRTVLGRLAGACLGSIAGATAVSVNIGPPTAPTAVSATGPDAASVDGLQVQLSEGPCVDAFEQHETVTSSDLTDEPRWPRLAERVAGIGVRSVVAVPIDVEGELVGALNVYARGPAAFTDADVRAVELLAVACGSILQGVWGQQQLRELVRQLTEALESRAVIEQAKGIVMARHGGTADEAFERLSTLSQHRNVRLRDVARTLVEQTAQPEGITRRRS